MEEYKKTKTEEAATIAAHSSEGAGSGLPAQYDAVISREYTNLVETDPQKRFVQYPSALRLLGDVSGQSVLDVGCGSGLFDRELAARGAIVVGYDVSAEQVALAQKAQQEEPMNIQYSVSDPSEFKTEKKFDKAVSVLVLHYAHDKHHLEQFFSSTSQALKDGGEFVCILVNPQFKRLGEVLYSRRFIKLGDGKMKADFFDRNQVQSFSVDFSDFSIDDYEQAAIGGGFKSVEWKPLKVEETGMQEMGQEYWKGFEDDCLYVGFVAHKA